MKNSLLLIALCFGTANIANSQVAAGGTLKLDQVVIGGGGGISTGGMFKVEGTAGQSAAGQKSTIAPFSTHAGFWNAAPLSPSAAMVPVGGRVVTADGQGVRNVYVSLSGGSGTARTALTGPFGYFRFDEVATGETYIVSVTSKRFQFASPVQFITVQDSLDDITFTALPN